MDCLSYLNLFKSISLFDCFSSNRPNNTVELDRLLDEEEYIAQLQRRVPMSQETAKKILRTPSSIQIDNWQVISLGTHRYLDLKEWVGAGQYSKVGKCIDLSTLEKVAIAWEYKKPPATLEEKQRMMGEFKGVEGVAQMLFVGEKVCVMKYYKDGNLEARLQKELTLDQKQRITQCLIKGLAHLHRLGYVHDDLNPSNILLEEGEAFIGDFNFMKRNNQLLKGTYKFFTVGKLEKKPGTQKDDIYNLGQILYQLWYAKVHPLVEYLDEHQVFPGNYSEFKEEVLEIVERFQPEENFARELISQMCYRDPIKRPTMQQLVNRGLV